MEVSKSPCNISCPTSRHWSCSKTENIRDTLIFSMGIEKNQWYEMGYGIVKSPG